MENKHTIGPWAKNGASAVNAETRKTIAVAASCDGDFAQQEANARLIAATTQQDASGPFDTDAGRIIAEALTLYASRTLGRDRSVAEELAITLPVEHHTAPDLLAALEQIERLSREADGNLVDVRAMLGDIARAAISKAIGA